jgi:DnaJ-domain-containing protein 1
VFPERAGMTDGLEEALRLLLEALERDVRRYRRALERAAGVLGDPKLWASFPFPFPPPFSPSSSSHSSVPPSFSDPYRVLGVSPSASDEEIRGAYLRMAKRCHPDMGGNAEEMKRINRAYGEIKRMRGMA